MKSAAAAAKAPADPAVAGGRGIAHVDRLIESHRDLLLQPGGDSLATEIEARLFYPWCADLPVAVSRRLPLLWRFWRFVKSWSWRLMLIYLMYAVASATVGFYFEKQIDDWQKSDAYTDLHLGVNFLVRRLAVWTGTPKMDSVHQLADGKCVVENPIFRKPLSCCNCKFNVTLSKVTDVGKVMENFDKLVTSGKARSFVIVNYKQNAVNYSAIRDTWQANTADINIGYNRLHTFSGPHVSSLDQLFANPAEPPADSAVAWHFSHVEALRHFRSLINRPNFISKSLEITLGRQFLFFGSDHSERVSLSSLNNIDGQLYIVGLEGELVFVVKSNPSCCRKPENRVARSATIRPGRMLSLPSSCYEVMARNNGTGYAAAYVGSVVLSKHPAEERQSGYKYNK